MLTHDRHTGVIQRVGEVMASSSWMYLTEEDQSDCLKLATLVCRHPDGGSKVAIDWTGYLAALTRRIAIRKHERRAMAETTDKE